MGEGDGQSITSNYIIKNKNSLNHVEQLNEQAGYLYKKSPAGFKLWQKRYFVLKDNKLKWYLKEG